jgi:hypothetical protein
MKQKFFLAFALILLTIQFSFAQNRLTEEQKTELKARFQAYKTKLSLSPDQAQKVRSTDSIYIMGLADLKKSSSGKFAKLKQLKSLNSERDKQMKAVLNKDQFNEYQQFKAEMQQKLKDSRKN